VSIGSKNLNFVGVWVPFDNGSKERLVNFKSFISSLESDWNCDLNRDKKFDKLLKRFLTKNEILDCHSLFESKLDFTYKKKEYRSRIDHIFICSRDKELIKEYNVMDEPQNFSDHNAISCVIDTNLVSDCSSSEATNVKFHHFDWKDQVFTKMYQCYLNDNLNWLVSKVEEINVSINKLASVRLIDEIFINLPRIFLKSARQAEKILKKSTRKKIIPNSDLQENTEINELLYETRQLYAEFETSNYNDLEIRKQISWRKKKFKHLVRKISYEQEKKKSVNLSNLRNSSNPKFWRTIAKFRRNRACVNKCSKEISLADFANFYSDLFSHNGKINSRKQNDIKDSVKSYHFSINDLVYDDVTNQDEIKSIIQKLSGNKSAGLDNICNEFFINGACSNLISILTWYFNKAICFGYIPSSFNISVVTPIPKKGTMSTPSDFRPVSVSNTMAVILENVILNKMECLSCIHTNQFGYKKKLSSKHAYFLVNEVANYYKKNGSKLHVLSLDATKAFDKMWRDGLFYKLIEWKMEFNPRKSASLTITKSGVNCQEKFVIDNVQLSNVDGFEEVEKS
ncbi:RNA-directed DNA polymerase from mobile element jockey, partial [Brachionus plicatilis]